MRSRLALVIVLAAMGGWGLGGCGGGSADFNFASVRGNHVAATISVAGGDGQTATAGTELPLALEVVVKNASGMPLEGQTVNFKIGQGNGSLRSGTATSDRHGIARDRWTLGTVAGPQKVEVSAAGRAGTAPMGVEFDALATAGFTSRLVVLSGDAQTAPRLQRLPSPIIVLAQDEHGNPVPGVPYAVTLDQGGSVLASPPVTDSEGQAALAWTLGPSTGIQQLSVVVANLSAVSVRARATEPPGLSIASGDLQTTTQNTLLAQGLVVTVADMAGEPVPGAIVVFAAEAGSGYFAPVSIASNAAGHAAWQGFFHQPGVQAVVATHADAAVVFHVSVTASNQHPYDGIYDCIHPVSGWQFKVIVVNGILRDYQRAPPPELMPLFSGHVDEATGALTMYLRLSNAYYDIYQGQLVIDALQAVHGAGTSSPGPGIPFAYSHPWTCSRR